MEHKEDEKEKSKRQGRQKRGIWKKTRQGGQIQEI